MASGMASAMISVMNRCVPRSMPLAQATTGVAGLRCGASVVAASRKFCAGVASRMMSARAAATMSAVMPMPSVEADAGQLWILSRRLHLRGAFGVSRIQHDVAAGAHRGACERGAICATADHRDRMKGRHVKIPRACWCSRPARSRWHRAASARGAARPSYRSARAPSVPRRPRRSSRRYRCRARAAE